MHTRLILNSSWKILGLLSFQTVITGFAAFFPLPELQSQLPQEAPHVVVKAFQVLKDIYSLVTLGPSGVLDAKLISSKPAMQSLCITFLGVSHCIGGCLGWGGHEHPMSHSLQTLRNTSKLVYGLPAIKRLAIMVSDFSCSGQILQ